MIAIGEDEGGNILGRDTLIECFQSVSNTLLEREE